MGVESHPPLENPMSNFERAGALLGYLTDFLREGQVSLTYKMGGDEEERMEFDWVRETDGRPLMVIAVVPPRNGLSK